jgi:hypothetical protein
MTSVFGITTALPSLNAESQKYLKKPFPRVSQSYPGQDTAGGPNDNWAAQMWSTYFVDGLVGCQEVIITIPLLFGTGWDVGDTGQTMSPQAYTDLTGKGSQPTPMSLDGIIAGLWDPMLRKTAQMIASKFPFARIRLGQEDYGNWYAWAGQKNEAKRIAARNRVAGIFMSVSPNFIIIWDIARSGPGGYNPAANGLNGAQHVGMIGFDLYDNMGLTVALSIIASAVALGKKLGIAVACCEWGLQSKDDPAWATGVFKALEADVALHVYYDKGAAALANHPNAATALEPLMAAAA